MTNQSNDWQSVQFGVCRGPISQGDYVQVPVDKGVQDLLVEMVNNASESISQLDVVTPRYEPAEQYGPSERLALPLNDALVGSLKSLYDEEHLPIHPDAMNSPESITSYFGIFHRKGGAKLMGIRRASQFKGVLKARLIRLLDDSLYALPDRVFKLDVDFDLLIDGDTVHILHPASFDQLAEIDEAVFASAVSHAQELEQRCPEIGFSSMAAYVATHKKAARLVASIRRRDDLDQTAITKFRRECQRSGIEFQMQEHKLCPAPKQELAFLEMLDRRRYVVSLVNGKWERYAAASRKSVGVHQPLKTAAAAVAGSARPRTTRLKKPKASPKI